MRTLFSILLALHLQLSFSQNSNDSLVDYVGGTMIVAVKANGAIVIGADSRTFHGNYDKSIQNYRIGFYSDGHRKIYPFGRYIMGISGSQSYKNLQLHTIADQFIATKPSYTTPDDLLVKLVLYLKKNYEPLYNDIIAHGSLICCGYYEGRPIVSHFTIGNVAISKEFATSRGDVPHTTKFKIDINKSITNQRKYIEFVIDSFPYLEGDKLMIGGPKLLASIDANNKITWYSDLKKFFSYTYTKDYVCDIANDKIKMVVLDKPGFADAKKKFQFQCEGVLPMD